MSKSKKMIAIICITIGIIAILAGALYFVVFRKTAPGKSDETAYVDSVAMITGLGNNLGTQNRYSGIVEAQESKDFQKEEQKTVKEIFVSVGDTVTVGTPLFEYDTDKTSLDLAQARIDLESLTNEINGYYAQVNELQKEKANAPASEQLNYTTQIQTAQLNAKRAEYNKKSKQAEIEKLEKDLTNATVASDMDGIVKSINTTGEYDYQTNAPKAFMTVMATGDYRIKAKVNEQNIWSLSEGQPVIIRSRVDADTTWTGTISRIDTTTRYEDSDGGSGSNTVYVGGMGMGDSSNTSSNYAIYITPDSPERLMLGQHVFVELDNGQDDAKSGLWLSAMYMVMDGDDAYAWVANKNNRLEKRKLELGNYDSGLDQYEILSGLSVDEYIAFPGNLLEEGMNCAINDGTHTNSAPETGLEPDGGMDMGGDMNIDDGSMIDDDMSSDIIGGDSGEVNIVDTIGNADAVPEETISADNITETEAGQ